MDSRSRVLRKGLSNWGSGLCKGKYYRGFRIAGIVCCRKADSSTGNFDYGGLRSKECKGRVSRLLRQPVMFFLFVAREVWIGLMKGAPRW